MDTRAELVSANSGRRHYRYFSELGTKEVRIRNDKQGWRYRIDGGEESKPYPSLWDASNAAFSACHDAFRDDARYTQISQRAPKGVPAFPGAKSRLHGVTLEWLEPGDGEPNQDDVRSYSAGTHEGAGTITLRKDDAGQWRYRVEIGTVHEASPVPYPDVENALDAATGCFFKEAKRAAKRR